MSPDFIQSYLPFQQHVSLKRQKGQLRLIIGRAGTGKTHFCIQEIQHYLQTSPLGKSLLFILPKQATFQAEQAILSSPSISGFSRLWICSFERLAQLILQKHPNYVPPIAEEQARLMLIYKAFQDSKSQLKYFKENLSLASILLEINRLCERLEHYGISPNQLLAMSSDHLIPTSLQAKLHDIALVFKYVHNLLSSLASEFPETMLTKAAQILHMHNTQLFEATWVDGFVEWTPKQLELLSAVILSSQKTTITICMDPESIPDRTTLPIWEYPKKGYDQIIGLAQSLGIKPEIQQLPLPNTPTRFATNHSLQQLETHWPTGTVSSLKQPSGIRLVQLPNPAEEVYWVARQIVYLTRNKGLRFRDIGIVVRTLESYEPLIKRIFSKYQIPYFIDTREPIQPHPIAELTHRILLIIKNGWKTEDIISLLRTDIFELTEEEIDLLEYEAIRRGWNREDWKRLSNSNTDFVESLRIRAITPIMEFEKSLLVDSPTPSSIKFNGKHLAKSIFNLWQKLNVREKMLKHGANISTFSFAHRLERILSHEAQSTVVESFLDWIKTLYRITGETELTLESWIELIELSLRSLTIGIIPPSLDQVMIGAIDRTRNPPLKAAFIMGWNEGLFPNPSANDKIFSEIEREILTNHFNQSVAESLSIRIEKEHYYAYIALTRASDYLFISYSKSDLRGMPLNPSPYLYWLKRIFPELEPESVTIEEECNSQPIHLCEIRHLLMSGSLPSNVVYIEKEPHCLLPTTPSSNYIIKEQTLSQFFPSNQIKLSASAIETYAACPFKFFVQFILRAKETMPFKIDPIRRGIFLHALLEAFHSYVTCQFKSWRSIDLTQIKPFLEKLAAQIAKQFEWQLFEKDAFRLIQRDVEVKLIERLFKVIQNWFYQGYAFEPKYAELEFGTDYPSNTSSSPYIQIPLQNNWQLLISGKIDRIDIYEDKEHTLVLLYDYKSSEESFDPVLLVNGLQIQLPLYCYAIENLCKKLFKTPSFQLIGFFTFPLRPSLQPLDIKDINENSYIKFLQNCFRPYGRYVDKYANLLGPVARRSLVASQALSQEQFTQIIERAISSIKEIGTSISQGQFNPDPYIYKGQIPCNNCAWKKACRIDPLRHKFRELNAPSSNEI